jgi:hypothetical protein
MGTPGLAGGDHQRLGLVEIAGDQVAALILAEERRRCRGVEVA